jgi:hypothetical protein
LLESSECLTLLLQEDDLRLAGVVVYEAHVIGTSANANRLRRSPKVGMYKFAICCSTSLRLLQEWLSCSLTLLACIAEFRLRGGVELDTVDETVNLNSRLNG